MKHNRIQPRLETLEDRLTPSYALFFDGLGNLSISGTPTIPGGAIIDIIVTAPGTYDITLDGNPIGSPLVAPGNLDIRVNSPTMDLITIDLGGNSIGGNLSITTGNGDDIVMVTGPGVIGGNVRLDGVNTYIQDMAIVGGNFYSNVRDNEIGFFDFFGSTIGGSLTHFSGNNIDNVNIGETFIGGNVYLNLGFDENGFTFDQFSSVGGGLTYLGGSAGDDLSLDGTIGGNAYLNMAPALDLSTNTLAFTGSLGGSLTYFGGLGADEILTFSGALAGSGYFNMGGGDNTLDTTGATISGPSFTYLGGFNTDTLTLDGTWALTRVFANLGAGDDVFTLETIDLSFLFVDFGAGMDTFTNNFVGPYFFPTLIRNV
ncbi:MAG: hypothetical protein ACFCD0_28270 [Gemmataceae bacterium]